MYSDDRLITHISRVEIETAPLKRGRSRALFGFASKPSRSPRLSRSNPLERIYNVSGAVGGVGAHHDIRLLWCFVSVASSGDCVRFSSAREGVKAL
jgi:hypothetical protein